MKTLYVYTQKECDTALKIAERNRTIFRFNSEHGSGNDILETILPVMKDFWRGKVQKSEALWCLDRHFFPDDSKLALSWFRFHYPHDKKSVEETLNAFTIIPKLYSGDCFEVTIRDAVEPITVHTHHGTVKACGRSRLTVINGTVILKDFAKARIEYHDNAYTPHVFAFDHAAVDSHGKAGVFLHDRAKGSGRAVRASLFFYAGDSSEVSLYNRSSGYVLDKAHGCAYDCAVVHASGNSLLEVFDTACSYASGSSLIKAHNASLVSVTGNATAEAYDASLVISSKPMNAVRYNGSALIIPNGDSPQNLASCIDKIIDHPGIGGDYYLACRTLIQSADWVSKKRIARILAANKCRDSTSARKYFMSLAEAEPGREPPKPPGRHETFEEVRI
jgi:hypothetical protein